jgi:predicted molibdopterin-dependent oxidoreductase YjgC
VETFANSSTASADVVLPAAGFAEVDGTTTNIEGRVTVLRQKVTPPGTARPDWMIAAELAFRLGADLGFASAEEIWAEIQKVSSAHAGISLAKLAAEADGVLAGRGTGAGSRPARAELPAADYEAPAIDSYSLRLVTRRRLYDRGTLVSHSPSLAGLAGTSSLAVNPDDLVRIGVTDGGRVKVTSSKGSLTTPVRFDATVPVGTAVLDWNQGDPSPRGLIDADATVTEVRVETTS